MPRTHHIHPVFLAFLVALFSSGVGGQRTSGTPAISGHTILGVLEEHAGVYAGDPYFRGVRVLFEKRGAEWVPFPTKAENEESLRRLTADSDSWWNPSQPAEKGTLVYERK